MGPIDGVCHGVRSTTTPHRLEYFLSNTFQQQSGGSGGTEGGLNMKGKMIWKRRRKVDIWWRRSAVIGMAEGQSGGRINGSRAVIGGQSRAAARQEGRFYFTGDIFFSKSANQKREGNPRSPRGPGRTFWSQINPRFQWNIPANQLLQKNKIKIFKVLLHFRWKHS